MITRKSPSTDYLYDTNLEPTGILARPYPVTPPFITTCVFHYTPRSISPYPIRQGDDVQVTGQLGGLQAMHKYTLHIHPLPLHSDLTLSQSITETPCRAADSPKTTKPQQPGPDVRSWGTLDPASLHTYHVVHCTARFKPLMTR